ncbi:flagellar motor protein MotB [Xinfangfangia sp. CPCC 101601]|uniref:Flagellar motor protein MotB n=1 Tax=Pseudogemmobacter lacusdianii TaxID=3069608 RepID=A0ABU0VUC9_9RHOB|nr:flagellar motor protein MotB [Xinfangfangia sp. CPCC 101601]MDQ2065337.1 flagellar motor protein MotB [Xinfangfangia sp. CPCC 101601]
MAGQSNAASVIIKRKKIIKGGGHHGGAWKVAYADFVTAMMAFFLLMWLLNATTEKQRKGLSDYFSPTIAINRVSAGGEGSLGGESIFSEDTRAKSGTGGSSDQKGASSGSAKDIMADEGTADLREIEKELLDRGGESRTMEQLLRHVVTRVTDEGLVIELYDLENAPLFTNDTAEPTPVTLALAGLLVEVLGLTTNKMAVNGYLRSYPVTLRNSPVWDLSSARAQRMRLLMEAAGLPSTRMERVSGYADRKPVTADGAAIRNNRLEVILLRQDR